jgi:hypothetical protein
MSEYEPIFAGGWTETYRLYEDLTTEAQSTVGAQHAVPVHLSPERLGSELSSTC